MDEKGLVHAESYKSPSEKLIELGKEQALAEVQTHEIQLKQTEALASLAQGVNQIAAFLSNGGLAELLSGYARTQSVQAILGGLASHDGRNALDARVLGQNALEITEQIEKVFDKYQERSIAKPQRDPVIQSEDDRPREGESREDYGRRMRAKRMVEEGGN